MKEGKHKRKEYFQEVTAKDKNGIEHKVIVCGIWQQFKESFEHVSKLGLHDGYVANVTVIKKSLCKSFTLGYAICNPTDEYNFEEGKKIALRRAKKYPIGRLGTLDFTMLNEDQCNLLVLGEAMHISKKIDAFIEKNKKK